MGGTPGKSNHWSEERWDRLCKRFCADFGPASAAQIIESVIGEVGGERISIPSLQDMEKRDRDRRMCAAFRGDYQELMARFNVSETTARRVVLRQRMIDRSREEDEYSP